MNLCPLLSSKIYTTNKSWLSFFPSEEMIWQRYMFVFALNRSGLTLVPQTKNWNWRKFTIERINVMENIYAPMIHSYNKKSFMMLRIVPSTDLSHDTSADFQIYLLQLHLQIKFWFEWADRYAWLVSWYPGISPCVPKGLVRTSVTNLHTFLSFRNMRRTFLRENLQTFNFQKHSPTTYSLD